MGSLVTGCRMRLTCLPAEICCTVADAAANTLLRGSAMRSNCRRVTVNHYRYQVIQLTYLTTNHYYRYQVTQSTYLMTYYYY